MCAVLILCLLIFLIVWVMYNKYYKRRVSKYSSLRVCRNDDPLEFEEKWIKMECQLRKHALKLKKEKRFAEAAECLKKARDAQYKTSQYWSKDTLLRIPKYFLLAGLYKEAYNEAMLISEIKWKVLGMIQPTMEISTAELRFLSLELAYEAACN